MDLAQKSFTTDPANTAQAHVGFYLIESGIRKLEEMFDYKLRRRENFERRLVQNGTFFYFGALIVLLSAAAVPLAFYLNYLKCTPAEWALVFTVAFLPVIDSCLAILNLLVTRLLPPRILSKIDLSRGIPAEAQTFRQG